MSGTLHFARQIARLALKEWRLLARNPHGLAVLFLMPAIFVLVMSFTLKNTLIARVEIPVAGWVLEDDGPVARQWTAEWLARHGGQRFASRQELQSALKKRQVEAGVIVRAPLLGADGRPRAEQLEMWLGNLMQPAAAARLRAELSFSLLQVQMKMAAAQAGPFASVLLASAGSSELLSAQGAPAVRYLYEIESGRPMTAVQQSVPAWLIFGMFFVVIPIAGVLIQERNDGTLTRLATFKVPAGAVLGGKLLAFMLLNWVQLVFMVLVGRWLVPALGGDALNLDVSPPWFILMVLATSAAAVGLALLIASWTRAFDHAAALGGGLNVVLGAIAGVMVPRMLMPPALQTISEWSPMGWALDGMQSVFLGSPDADRILPRAGLLLGFAALCLLLSWWRIRKRL
ncbi:MAG: transporter permease [Ramlibacter sp.]|nr:transporter permease [Ramlibacter sp.]